MMHFKMRFNIKKKENNTDHMTDTLKYHCYSGQYEYDKRLSNLIPVNMKINLKRWQGRL